MQLSLGGFATAGCLIYGVIQPRVRCVIRAQTEVLHTECPQTPRRIVVFHHHFPAYLGLERRAAASGQEGVQGSPCPVKLWGSCAVGSAFSGAGSPLRGPRAAARPCQLDVLSCSSDIIERQLVLLALPSPCDCKEFLLALHSSASPDRLVA